MSDNKRGRDTDTGSESAKKSNKKHCEHEPARIWLASNNYQEARYCRKCLELLHAKKYSKEVP